MGVIETIGIVLLIAGFLLIGIELTIPGFGIPGISGITCLILGIITSSDSFEQGLTITIIVLVILAIMITVVMTVLRKVTPPIVLEDSLKPDADLISSKDMYYLVGKEGVSVTPLRPSGKCRIEGVEFDVRTDGRYIEKETCIIIKDIHESTIIVTEKLK